MSPSEDSWSLDLTPSWSDAFVLTAFIVVSLLLERSIHWLCIWLRSTNRKPLLAVVEKMKEELMLLGFISLLLTAMGSTITSICIPSRLYESAFDPCTKTEMDEEREKDGLIKQRTLLAVFLSPYISRRVLNGMHRNTCKENHESIVSHEGLEQLHRFIFVMAVTHIVYSCLTMFLAVVKIHRWRKWENAARIDAYESLGDTNREKSIQRQSTSVGVHASSPSCWSSLLLWLTCFLRQFGRSVVRNDYLTLRKGFIANHHLLSTYDFHSYMTRSMEDEFQSVFGVSGPLWCFVVAFMLFNVKGSDLYFWIALFPIVLVLITGTKLSHVIATLVLESGDLSSGAKLKPRDELFWFKKPEILLRLIHFILFQNAFELASFIWFWWEFGFNSCYIINHKLVYLRLILGFVGQFLCSYSTLPLYALVTQMGSKYKSALIPQRIRETIYGWGETARRRRKLRIHVVDDDDATIQTHKETVRSLGHDRLSLHSPRHIRRTIELQSHSNLIIDTYSASNPIELQSHSNVINNPYSASNPIELQSHSNVINDPYSASNPSCSHRLSSLLHFQTPPSTLPHNSPTSMLEEFERSSSTTARNNYIELASQCSYTVASDPGLSPSTKSDLQF